jgi:hypothetical protein
MELELDLSQKLTSLKHNLSISDIKRIMEEKADPVTKKPMSYHMISKYLEGEIRFEEVGIDIVKRGIVILKEKTLKLDSIIKSLEDGIETAA